MFENKSLLILVTLLVISFRFVGAKNNSPSIQYFVDETNSLSFEEIQKSTFTEATNGDLNVGFSNSTHWYKFELNEKEQTKNILQFISPELDSIEIFFLENEQVLTTKQTGLLLPFNEREIKNRLPTVRIPKDAQEIVIKIRSQLPVNFGITFHDKNTYQESYTLDLIFFSLINFSILLICLYNLVIFSKVKQALYGYYSMYLLALFGSSLAITGFSNQFLFNSGESINYWFANCAVSLMLITFSIFTNHVLEFKKNLKFFYWFFNITAIIGFICFCFSPFLNRDTIAKSLHIFPAISMILAIIGSIIVLIKGEKQARFYLIGWSFFFLGALGVQTRGWGLLDYVWASNLSFIGGALETIFFSFTVSETMKNYQVEIEKSESKLNTFEKEIESLREQLVNHKEDDIPLPQTPIYKENINIHLLNPLSARELEVLTLLAKGKTNKIVAEELYVSVNTVKTHIRNIYEKLNANNRTEAINKATGLEII